MNRGAMLGIGALAIGAVVLGTRASKAEPAKPPPPAPPGPGPDHIPPPAPPPPEPGKIPEPTDPEIDAALQKIIAIQWAALKQCPSKSDEITRLTQESIVALGTEGTNVAGEVDIFQQAIDQICQVSGASRDPKRVESDAMWWIDRAANKCAAGDEVASQKLQIYADAFYQAFEADPSNGDALLRKLIGQLYSFCPDLDE